MHGDYLRGGRAEVVTVMGADRGRAGLVTSNAAGPGAASRKRMVPPGDPAPGALTATLTSNEAPQMVSAVVVLAWRAAGAGQAHRNSHRKNRGVRYCWLVGRVVLSFLVTGGQGRYIDAVGMSAASARFEPGPRFRGDAKYEKGVSEEAAVRRQFSSWATSRQVKQPFPIRGATAAAWPHALSQAAACPEILGEFHGKAVTL